MDFPKINLEDWKKILEKELKGKKFEDLITQTEENIPILPLYTDQKKSSSFQNEKPGWKYMLILSCRNPDWKNLALEALQNDTDNLYFLNVSDNHVADIQEVTKNFPNVDIWYSGHGILGDAYQTECPVYTSLRMGDHLSTALEIEKSFSGQIELRGDLYQEAGGSAVETLACLLLHLHAIHKNVQFPVISLGLGRNYFMEIAKFRALRQLIGHFFPSLPNYKLVAYSCLYNKTTGDIHNNILRLTTEAMSGVIGGADCICLDPFNHLTGEADAFSYKISRNISHLLKHESFFDKVADPLKGSYFIEDLTQSIVVHVKELFEKWMIAGGFEKLILNETIQDVLNRKLKIRLEKFLNNEDIYVGINQYMPKDFKREIILSHTQIPNTKFLPILQINIPHHA